MAKERKVVYSLEVVEGQGNAKAVDNTIAGLNATTAATKAATAALKEHTAANREAAKSPTRAAVAAAGGNTAAIDAFTNADAKRAVNEMGRAYSAAEREAGRHARMLREVQAQNQRVLAGYVQVGRGITQAARASIYFGATNEKSAEQMLKLVLAAEGIVSAFSAAKDIAGGLGKVLGQRGIGGGMAGGIGGGLAGGAAAGGLGGMLAGGAAASAVGVAAKAAAVAAAAGAGMIVLDSLRSYRRGENIGANVRDGVNVVTNWTGLTDTVGDHRRGWNASLTNAENRTMGDKLRPRMNALAENHRAGLDLAENRAGLMAGGPSPAAQLAAIQARQSLAQKELTQAGTRWNLPELKGADGALVREGVARREVDAAERMLRLTTERHQVELQINRDSIEGSRQRIRNLEQERDARRAMMAEAGSERRSGAMAFNDMSPVQRALALSGVRKAQAGDTAGINDAEAREMDALGGTAASIVAARSELNGLKGGYGEIAAWNNRDSNMIAKGINNLTAKINTEATLKVSLEMNEAQLVDKFKLAIVPLFDLIEVRSRQLFGLEEQVNQMRRAQEIRHLSEDSSRGF